MKVNNTKTEFARIYIDNDKNIKRNEEWRRNKTLGSKLSSKEDILNRIKLSIVAFAKLKHLWTSYSKITSETKIKIYETTVVSILLYNHCTWAAPKEYIEKVDTCHRNHIRQILNIKWPQKITNEKLYQLANVSPLSQRTPKARWKMLGKVLRQDENSAAYCSLIFARNSKSTYDARRGRPPINLYDTITQDLLSRQMSIETDEDLQDTKQKARDLKQWENI